MYNTRQQTKTYDIHPTSIKLIRSGHPWVTLDQYSEKFHPKEKFIVAADRKRPFALLIHDPTHKSVKARVWATKGNFQGMMKSFKNDLLNRIRKSFKTRKTQPYTKLRNHYYLAFGENDELPGIFIKYLNDDLLIEFYMEFWKPYQDFIVQNTVKIFNEVYAKDLTISDVWTQYRSQNKNNPTCLDPNATYRKKEITEFDVKYNVYIGKHYDTGIYTDMAAIRGRIKRYLSESNSLLNLYSYTGAYSLYGLSLGIKEVTSVDISESYQEWLNENLALNENIDNSRHTSLTMSSIEALKLLKSQNKKFSFIISDPPSSSCDGNRRTNALGDYQELLPLMSSILEEKGKMIVFLNTHSISIDKFKNKIKNIIHKNNLPLYLGGNLYLSEDCPFKKGFPEGSYLKGIVLKYKDKDHSKKEEAPKSKPAHKNENNLIDGDQEKQVTKKKTVKKVTKKKVAKKVTKKATSNSDD